MSDNNNSRLMEMLRSSKGKEKIKKRLRKDKNSIFIFLS